MRNAIPSPELIAILTATAWTQICLGRLIRFKRPLWYCTFIIHGFQWRIRIVVMRCFVDVRYRGISQYYGKTCIQISMTQKSIYPLSHVYAETRRFGVANGKRDDAGTGTREAVGIELDWCFILWFFSTYHNWFLKFRMIWRRLRRIRMRAKLCPDF